MATGSKSTVTAPATSGRATRTASWRWLATRLIWMASSASWVEIRRCGAGWKQTRSSATCTCTWPIWKRASSYHHHLGINVWAGVGAPPPPPDAVGLRHWELIVPNQTEAGRVADRARKAGVGVEETERGLLVRDPSRNAVVVAVG